MHKIWNKCVLAYTYYSKMLFWIWNLIIKCTSKINFYCTDKSIMQICSLRLNSLPIDTNFVDFHPLNWKIIRDQYPLPVVEEILDKLGNRKIFTIRDLKNAFFHAKIDVKSKKYMCFITDNLQYEFNEVPFDYWQVQLYFSST